MYACGNWDTYKPLLTVHTLLLHRCQIHKCVRCRLFYFFLFFLFFFWRRDYDTVKNSELPQRRCSSANMAGRLLMLNMSLEVQNIIMWEPLVSMHMWMYSCIVWQSTVARCALLKHAFQNIWMYIPFSLMFMYELCGFCLFVTVPSACFCVLDGLCFKQLCKTGKVWELIELRDRVFGSILSGESKLLNQFTAEFSHF